MYDFDRAALGTTAQWRVATRFGSNPTATDPVEVSGTRAETPGTRAPDLASAVLSFADVSAAGASQLLRNGQSPNIFASDAIARTVQYANSSYAFPADFSNRTTFSYRCEMEQLTPRSVTVPGTPGTPVQGFYTSPGEGDCQGLTPKHEKWSQNVGVCTFHKTGDAVPGTLPTTTTTFVWERVPASDTTHTITQDDTASGTGTELNGGAHTFTGQSLRVQAVVCNSPIKSQNTWRAQNGNLGLGGASSLAKFQELGTATIPSNSLPTI